MKRTLFGDIVLEESDFFNIVVEDFKQKHRVYPKEDTCHGFTCDLGLNKKKGIYGLWRGDDLLYIGSSDSCVRTRVGRFTSVVRGTNRLDEDHPGARKYLKHFGQDLSGLSTAICELSQKDLPDYLNIVMIETYIIKQLKPICNEETYKYYKIERLNHRITNVLSGTVSYA